MSVRTILASSIRSGGLPLGPVVLVDSAALEAGWIARKHAGVGWQAGGVELDVGQVAGQAVGHGGEQGQAGVGGVPGKHHLAGGATLVDLPVQLAWGREE